MNNNPRLKRNINKSSFNLGVQETTNGWQDDGEGNWMNGIDISQKILFYIKNKTKITFRLQEMSEYFFTGIIAEIDEDNKSSTYRDLVLKLYNGEEMLLHEDDILEPSLHPASIHPINIFQRTTISEETRMKIFERSNYKCEIKSDGCTKRATEIDHIIPVSKGGSNEEYNLQASCLKCNRKKSNKIE